MPRQGSGAMQRQDVHSGWSSHEANNLPQPLSGRPGQDFWIGDVGSLVADIEKQIVFQKVEGSVVVKNLHKLVSRARLVAESMMAEEGIEMPHDPVV